MASPAKIARYRYFNTQRKLARALVHRRVGTDVFLAAQNFKCGICGEQLLETDQLSVDHVYNFARVKRHAGNLLLAHPKCNQDKDDDHPSRFSQQMLGQVNSCLRYRKGVYKAAQTWKGRKDIAVHMLPFEKFAAMLLKGLLRKIFL